jgi:4'-phosphopantetheinyl transferase
MVMNPDYLHNPVYQMAPPRQILNLKRGEVHLWWVNLGKEIFRVDGYYQILSIDEKNRAARYAFQQHRDNFIARRGMLRMILSRYLGIHAKYLRFKYNQFGRPSLDLPVQNTSLFFNSSHSNSFSLYAITSDREVGIDIEFLNNSFSYEGIIHQVLSPKERQLFLTLHPNLRFKAFCESWTAKEAYLKAAGFGLSTPLNQVEVFFQPNNPKIKLGNRSLTPNRNQVWSLRKLGPPPGYVAALAVEGDDFEIRNYCRPNVFLQAKSLGDIFCSSSGANTFAEVYCEIS